MDLSRRRVLRGVVGLTIAAVTPIRWVAPAVAAPAAGGWFSKGSYPPLVGSTFFVTTGNGVTASLRLAAVGDITAGSLKRRSAPSDGRFSLQFTSSSAFAQGTYLVRHASLGSINLFVVPVGGGGATQQYEVIVNRLA